MPRRQRVRNHRLQQKWKEDEDVIHMLSQAHSELGDEGGRTPQENLRKPISDKFPSQRCNVVYFRTRLVVGIIPQRISRNLYQRLSEPILVKHAGYYEHLSDEGLTDGWKNHLLLEWPLGSMLTANGHVLSDSVFAQAMLLAVGKRMQKHSCTVTIAKKKKRNDTAGQSIDIEWHVSG